MDGWALTRNNTKTRRSERLLANNPAHSRAGARSYDRSKSLWDAPNALHFLRSEVPLRDTPFHHLGCPATCRHES